MEWTDEGVVLGVRRLGETSVIVELMTRDHGRHAGVVRGGRSARLQPVLQPGNSVAVVWRARMEEHLGVYAVEAREMRAARYMGSAMALNVLGAALALARLLPERDPHRNVHDALALLAGQACHEPADADLAPGPGLLALFELSLLAELGFGLDLQRCVATGVTENLAYVSPKSGRAVSAAAGAPWKERLLPLPAFLRAPTGRPPHVAEALQALRLTGFFLQRHVYGPRGLPAPGARERVIGLLQRMAAGAAAPR
ncbi:DNA repair protein RecO [Camelimonas abortus]|uniref:DNA repair protein RecO n=1 Tax=Camelimonas abortus TaxID=1017184 RepID=A0ABV7LBL2_9HYPH